MNKTLTSIRGKGVRWTKSLQKLNRIKNHRLRSFQTWVAIELSHQSLSHFPMHFYRCWLLQLILNICTLNLYQYILSVSFIILPTCFTVTGPLSISHNIPCVLNWLLHIICLNFRSQYTKVYLVPRINIEVSYIKELTPWLHYQTDFKGSKRFRCQ